MNTTQAYTVKYVENSKEHISKPIESYNKAIELAENIHASGLYSAVYRADGSLVCEYEV